MSKQSIQDIMFHAIEGSEDVPLADVLIDNGAKLSEKMQKALIDRITSSSKNTPEQIEFFKRLIPLAADEISRRDAITRGELVIKVMQSGCPELAPALITAGAVQEMNLDFSADLDDDNKVHARIIADVNKIYKNRNIEEIENWTPLTEIAIQIAIARGKGENTERYIVIARDLVASGAKIETVKINGSISKNMLDILKDNIEFQKTDQAKALAKDDFDKMKDALREGQAALKAQIIEDRKNWGEYGALVDEAVYQLKKIFGGEKTERDRLREKQEEIGKALRESRSLISSVKNVVTGNFGSKKRDGQSH